VDELLSMGSRRRDSYYNLGLEPCIGAGLLGDAVTQYDLFAALPPHGSKTWWLEIELKV
jgi:hypothetical protein